MGISLSVINTKISGLVLYEGPSVINGKPIVVIATGLDKASKNEKTGEMVQVWIMVGNKAPLQANKSGADEAVCGSCKHRHFRSCYVNLAHGPGHVYAAYKAGKYARLPMSHRVSELFRDKHVRLGAYGDPAAVPIDVWNVVTRVAAGWTGYTHAWKKCDIAYRDYCMASADTESEARDAMGRGWKPFYARQEGTPLPKGFFSCPASAEQGKRLNCMECRVCKGGEHREGQGVVSIVVHGPSWKKTFFNRGMKLLLAKKKIVGVFHKAS
jgi:hypothetical protein